MPGSLRFWRCPDCGDLHDKYDWPDNHRRPGEVLAAPMVILDTMPRHVQSQVTGEWFDSKRKLRDTYLPSGNKEGVRFTEVGNDPALMRPRQKPKPDRMKIRAAIHGAFSKVGLGA